jgi:hypothetical protein
VVFFGALLRYAACPWLPFGRTAATPAIVFYGFSILGDVMNKGVFPAFRQRWAAEGHGDVAFRSSFAGSGTITNQIVLGAPAELALLSLESDAERLSDAGVIPAGSWKRLPESGVVDRTPFVIFMRGAARSGSPTSRTSRATGASSIGSADFGRRRAGPSSPNTAPATASRAAIRRGRACSRG